MSHIELIPSSGGIRAAVHPEEINNPISIAVMECADMNLIYDRVLASARDTAATNPAPETERVQLLMALEKKPQKPAWVG